MACPFRVVLIVVSCLIALLAAVAALSQPVQIDSDGKPRPSQTVKEAMTEWYMDNVDPLLPSFLRFSVKSDDEDDDAMSHVTPSAPPEESE